MPIVSSPVGVTDEDVFVGGVVGFGDLADPTNTTYGRATGNLGLYMQETGLANAASTSTLGYISLGMVNTGPGETELGIEPASLAEGWFDVYWHSWFSNYGLVPAEINLVIGYTLVPGLAELSLSDFVNYVNIARRFGVTSVAPIFSPNGQTFPLDSFANNSYYAEIRAAAIYGGGITLDIPPHYFFSNTAAYQSFAYQEIQWAQQNHIRSTVIISPNGDDAFFLHDTAALIASLTANNATPSEWVVENYNPSDTDGVGSEQTTNTIANAALYAATWAPTSRPTGSMSVGNLPTAITAPSLGAGVTVTDTVHVTNGNGQVYVAVMDSAGGVESYSSRPITLDSKGDATVSAYLEASSDYIRVDDSLTSPNFIAYSNPVTIVEPVAAISLTAPGTIQEAGPGVGVSVTELIAATNVAGHVDIEVLTSSGAVESGWQVVPLINGLAFVSVFMAQSGDYVQATDNETTPTATADSSPVVIIDPVQTITISAPGTVQETTVGAGVDVVESISATNVTGHVDLRVLTETGSVESGWQVVPLINGIATATVHFADSGDYVYVANSETAPTVSLDSSPITITESAKAIVIPDSGTVQEGSPGSGVNAVENISTTNIISHVDLEALTASGSSEGGWRVAPLTSGISTLPVHLAKNGHYIRVADKKTTPTAVCSSTPIAIAEPPDPNVNTPLTANFSVASMSLAATTLTIAGSDTTGSSATMREFLNGAYIGVVTPHLQSGKFIVKIEDVPSGTYQLALTIDDNENAAFYDFTRTEKVITLASPVVAMSNTATTGSVNVFLSQFHQTHAELWPTV